MQDSPSSQPRRAALFRNGKSQAVRIPRSLEFAASEVWIHREGDRLVLEPMTKSSRLLEMLARLEPISELFPDIDCDLAPLDEVKW